MADGIDFDASQFNKFNKLLGEFNKMFEDFIKKFLTKRANMVISKTKKKTPVDTGALRRSWVLGDVVCDGKNFYAEILNGMEYATEIEYGHRIVVHGTEVGWYDGRFMLKTSVDEISRQIPSSIVNEMQSYIKEKFGGLV